MYYDIFINLKAMLLLMNIRLFPCWIPSPFRDLHCSNNLRTLDGDVSREPANNSTIPPLPLAVAGRTQGIVHTLERTPATYALKSTPGAVTVSEQMAAITVVVDCNPIAGHSSGIIVAKIGWPLLSCCSGGEQCD